MIKHENLQVHRVHTDGVFRKPYNWRQIYKQTSSTLTIRREEKIISTTQQGNTCLMIVLKKYRSNHRRCRSSHRRCSVKKGALKYLANFMEKHPCWSLLQAFFLIRIQHKCFAVKFAEHLTAPILKNICKRLLLELFYKKAFLKNFAIFTGPK